MASWANVTGVTGAPFDAYLTLRGLRTLFARVERQQQTAAELAQFLQRHPSVEAVHYPGLETHPGHGIAKAQQAGFGAMLGHAFPVWLGFKGGKGVATGLGVLLAASWWLGLAVAAVWLAAVALTRISSAGALAACAAAPVLALLAGDLHLAAMAAGTIQIWFQLWPSAVAKRSTIGPATSEPIKMPTPYVARVISPWAALRNRWPANLSV